MTNLGSVVALAPQWGERSSPLIARRQTPSTVIPSHAENSSFKTALEGFCFFDELFCTAMIFLSSGLVSTWSNAL